MDTYEKKNYVSSSKRYLQGNSEACRTEMKGQKLKCRRWQYLTRGKTPNSLHAILITHLHIHLKHTWELAWVIEGNLLQDTIEVQEFSW